MSAEARRARSSGLEVRAPEPDHEVVRRVRRERAHGTFPSRKAGTGLGGHMWFAEVERDCMRLLEADPRIVSYRPRPGRLLVTVDGKRHEHRPSFLVSDGARKLVLDVVETPRDAAGSPQPLGDPRPDLTAELRERLRERGFGYQLWTRARIRLQPRFGNACALVRFISVDPRPEDEISAEAAIVAAGGAAPWGAVEAALGGPDPHARLCALALAGVVIADMSVPLSPQTVLRLLPRREVAR
ncbi:MAG: hypothetical protein K2X49_19735 [Acetobacteraceae bacterium]|nr:hypothetical protein [Acetobacteraceae bacterium]